MKVYNVSSLDRNSRFIKALFVGLLCAIGCGIAYGLLYQFLRIQMHILYIGIGFIISLVIKKVGRGVSTRFCILGALLTLLAIFIGDTIAHFGLLEFLKLFTDNNLTRWIYFVRIFLSGLLSTNIYSILGLLFRISGIVYAYQNSIIL